MELKKEYDVIVVGAGPGGCHCAKLLAEKGLDVLLIDRAQEIGVPKETGEGLSKRAERNLGIKIPDYCIAQFIDGAWIYAPNGKMVEICCEGSEGYILEMKRFVKWLACEASLAGAKVMARSFAYDVVKDNDFVSGVRFRFMGNPYEVRSKVVVAADGVESLIAKRAGLDTSCSPVLVDSGFQYEMCNVELEDEHKIEIFVGNEIAPRGYVWIFPKGRKTANVGIGISGANNVTTAKELLDRFILQRENLRKGSIVEVNGGCIPVGGFLKNMVTNGLVTIGDAAHQVNPLHGGGIAEAMYAASIAARAIEKCFEKNDFSAGALQEYNAMWWKERGEKLKMVEKGRELVEKLNDEQLNQLAEVLQGEDIEKIVHGDITKLIKVLVKFGIKQLVK